ncbi:GL26044 [Drosophila persimilis]|uniref:Glutaredoxin 3 n=2 Tax=pseudoobscura subgroup TaxID=32358 RepID=A0A6I8ULB2_DROPS|nr:glutaredoxin 3 [Drosophila pseudoobscura]XP_002018878.1 glutaredoxin 3 [Drosophila persimilis]EDW37074.1 GL26044 [Drosophila persimilis]
MPVLSVSNAEEYQNLINADKTTAALFAADWAEQCAQVKDVLEELSKLLGDKLQFISLNAEQFPEISMKHQIEAVPTVIFFAKGSAVDRVDGVDVAAISSKSKKLAESASSAAATGQSLDDRLKALVNTAPLMIFMKGDRNAPRCGFSKQLIAIVNDTSLPYETFDILSDEEVRQGLKTYSDWPTYPQVYVKGELIGGLDIIKELLANKELETTLKG